MAFWPTARLAFSVRPRVACASAGALALIAGLAACTSITGAGEFTIDSTVPATSADKESTSPGGAPGGPTSPGGVDPRGPATNDNSGVVTVIAPDGLDFGDMACGNTPPGRRVEIRNTGTTEITFQAALADGTRFNVVPLNGTVGSGGAVVLSVSTPGVPSNGPVGVHTDRLTVTTNAAGDTPHLLDTQFSATGAILSVSPGSLDFGQLTATPSTKTIAIRNDGNVEATLAISFLLNTVSSYDLDSTAPVVVPAGGVVLRKVTAHPPKSGPTEKDGKLGFSTTSALCGPVPPPMSLSCRRPD